MNRRLPLTVLAAVLLLPACGDDGDAKAEYVKAATAVCDKAAQESEALKPPAAAADFAPYADGIVRIAEQAQRELSELEPPSEDREELERRVLEPFADVVEEGKAFAAKVRAAGEDQAKLLPLLGEVPDAGDVDLDYLRSYGLGSCADVISQE